MNVQLVHIVAIGIHLQRTVHIHADKRFGWKTVICIFHFLHCQFHLLPLIWRSLLLMLARLREIPPTSHPLALPPRDSPRYGYILHPQSAIHRMFGTPMSARFVYLQKGAWFSRGVHRCSWTSSSRRALTLPEWSQICGAVSRKWLDNLKISRIWMDLGNIWHTFTCNHMHFLWGMVLCRKSSRLTGILGSSASLCNQSRKPFRVESMTCWCIYIKFYLNLYTCFYRYGTQYLTHPNIVHTPCKTDHDRHNPPLASCKWS